jgi:ribonuclease R
MERDGQLIYTRRGTYAPVDKLDLICGRVSGHRDGFGFLIPDDGSDDLFLSPSQMRLVFDGDRGLARVSGVDRRGRREGVLVEVISRAHESVVGRYFEEGGIGYVTPDNPKIQQEVLVTAGRNGGAKIGQFVDQDHPLANAALPAARRCGRSHRQLHGAGHGNRRRPAQLRHSARLAQ